MHSPGPAASQEAKKKFQQLTNYKTNEVHVVSRCRNTYEHKKVMTDITVSLGNFY